MLFMFQSRSILAKTLISLADKCIEEFQTGNGIKFKPMEMEWKMLVAEHLQNGASTCL